MAVLRPPGGVRQCDWCVVCVHVCSGVVWWEAEAVCGHVYCVKEGVTVELGCVLHGEAVLESVLVISSAGAGKLGFSGGTLDHQ